MISDKDTDVTVALNMKDISETHPYLATMEPLEDGSVQRVNTFSYQRYKFRLYQLTSPIITDIYSQDLSTIPAMVEKVRQIHDQLESWASTLPPELRLNEPESYQDDLDVCTTYRLQAMVLHMAYHNIKILLHRPLLSCRLDKLSKSMARPVQKAVAFSKSQCWESAIRTSEFAQYEYCLDALRGSYGAAYMGMHLFTAGMMISIVALSDPLTDKVPEAKQALARIIRMTRKLQNETLLAAQSSRILEKLVFLILAKEMEAIFGNRPSSAPPPDARSATDESALSQSNLGTAPIPGNRSPRGVIPVGQALKGELPGYLNRDCHDLYDQGSLAESWWDDINLIEGISTIQQGTFNLRVYRVWLTVPAVHPTTTSGTQASTTLEQAQLTCDAIPDAQLSEFSNNLRDADYSQMWLWDLDGYSF